METGAGRVGWKGTLGSKWMGGACVTSEHFRNVDSSC